MKKLISWSLQNFDELPWRQKRSVYNTLVSEIMLQQTTVGTVMNHFEKFIQEYPNIKKLSKASEEQICISWKGLGYYRRARNLLKAAQFIVQEYKGEIPTNYEQLIEIPGIGDYTANAIRGIGHNKRGLAIDANIKRVLSRYYGIKEENSGKLHKILASKFQNKEILKNIKDYRNINEALMDLGREVCKARVANCSICPIKLNCKGRIAKAPLDYPFVVKDKKIPKPTQLKLLRILVLKGKKVLAYKKKKNQWLEGQFEVPTFILETEDEKLNQYPFWSNQDFGKTKKITTGITKYKIENCIWKINFEEFNKLKLKGDFKFVSIDQTKSNLSTTAIKILKKYE